MGRNAHPIPERMAWFRIIGCIALLLSSTRPVNADLIGDVVTIAHHSPSLGTVAAGGGPVNITVQSGTVDRVLFYYNLYTVNIEAESVHVVFRAGPNTWDSGVPDGFNGLVATSLDGADGLTRVAGFSSISTSLGGGWDDSRASFEDNSVAFNWDHLSFTAGTYFDATLDLQVIPEPSMVVLVILGASVLLRLRSRDAGCAGYKGTGVTHPCYPAGR